MIKLVPCTVGHHLCVLVKFAVVGIVYLGIHFLLYYPKLYTMIPIAKFNRLGSSRAESSKLAEMAEQSRLDVELQKGFGPSNSSIPNEHITVITILDNKKKLKDYALGLDTMRCYCRGRGYNYIQLDLSTNNSFDKACKKQHIWYRRHCVLAEILKRAPAYNGSGTWFVAVDADTGVINPRHKIQEWIDDTVDIIFYNRIWQFELMAGIFMSVVMDMMKPQRPAERKICDQLLSISTNFAEAFVYEACARVVMRNMSFDGGKILIYKKGGSWCRDGWLTSSKWCPNDFFFHGWQIRSKTGHELYEQSILSHTFKDSDCLPDNFLDAWQYNKSFMDSCENIEAALKEHIDRNDESFYVTMLKVQDFAAHHSYNGDFFSSFSAPWNQVVIA